eukprot:tig00021038_g17527.t1
MGGGRSRHRPPPPPPPRPPPPPPPRPPPPPPPKPAIPPPPAKVVDPHSGIQIQLNATSEAGPPGREVYSAGPIFYSQKQTIDLIKSLIGMDATPATKVVPPRSAKGTRLNVPRIINRYAKHLCDGKERFSTKKAVLSHGDKCELYGHDLAQSKDYGIEIDEFKFGPVKRDTDTKPSVTVVADSDNDGPSWQKEMIQRTVQTKDVERFGTKMSIETGNETNVMVGACLSVTSVSACARGGAGFSISGKGGNEKMQTKEKISSIKLFKEITIPPYTHADVIWTVFDREVDLTWDAKAVFKGNFNIFMWNSPKEKADINSCAQTLKAYFSQKLLYGGEDDDQRLESRVPGYLKKCGLKVISVPVCEVLRWDGKIPAEQSAKDFSSCWYRLAGSYEAQKAVDWKSDVKMSPLNTFLKGGKLAVWESAYATGARPATYKADERGLKDLTFADLDFPIILLERLAAWGKPNKAKAPSGPRPAKKKKPVLRLDHQQQGEEGDEEDGPAPSAAPGDDVADADAGGQASAEDALLAITGEAEIDVEGAEAGVVPYRFEDWDGFEAGAAGAAAADPEAWGGPIAAGEAEGAEVEGAHGYPSSGLLLAAPELHGSPAALA